MNTEQFKEEMLDMFSRKASHGLKGVNVNAFKRNEPELLVTRRHQLSEAVVQVACQLHRKGELVDYKAWVHWMTDAVILRPGGDSVTVLHRSRFYITHAERLFGEMLNRLFGAKVRWIVSPEINEEVTRQ